jgi:hypothetical protein
LLFAGDEGLCFCFSVHYASLSLSLSHVTKC